MVEVIKMGEPFRQDKDAILIASRGVSPDIDVRPFNPESPTSDSFRRSEICIALHPVVQNAFLFRNSQDLHHLARIVCLPHKC